MGSLNQPSQSVDVFGGRHWRGLDRLAVGEGLGVALGEACAVEDQAEGHLDHLWGEVGVGHPGSVGSAVRELLDALHVEGGEGSLGKAVGDGWESLDEAVSGSDDALGSSTTQSVEGASVLLGEAVLDVRAVQVASDGGEGDREVVGDLLGGPATDVEHLGLAEVLATC